MKTQKNFVTEAFTTASRLTVFGLVGAEISDLERKLNADRAIICADDELGACLRQNHATPHHRQW